MEKREGYRGPRFSRRQPPVHQHRVWVPAVPSWEKEFCCKTGSFTTWKEFLKAKEQTRFADKILEWNDSAANEAFINAKKLFFTRINGLDNATCNDHRYSLLHDADLYIDRISWDHNEHDDDQEKLELLRELESAAAARKFYDHDDEQQQEEEDEVDLARRIQIQDIVATGWEQEEVYFSSTKCLTDLIIGDD